MVASAITGGIWLIDALFFAPARNERAVGAPRDPLMVEYARSFFPVIFAVLVLRSFLVEPFRIPSGSMMPTLLVGDFILVNKFSYGIRLPVLNKKVIDIDLPQRGDVAVFRYPKQPWIDYIKRIVAVPGDTIHYRGKVLYINGKPMQQTPVGIYNGTGGGARISGYLRAVEDLNGVEHEILMHPMAPDLAMGCNVLSRGPFTIPEGHYFVMGDNRDNSNDSRCWGLVPEENLIGEAFAIWMNWDGEKTGFPISWERIGRAIN
ncbi:signal peptidase I [endosymbiont of Riftia pachyptila (vent Ph05)]|uniref:Signal peptidase I n=1 Tax=endosymbiont of Riftia pachyptila (vent Ph05) TaxID=1048808 RepID=G2DAC6_9GAMM|nr:signal peptidase I [endosymbiont of Riftia pachyptila (vent Ph05)]